MVTSGEKARTDKGWAVCRGVREIRIDDRLRAYDISQHQVYCHYPREVGRTREPAKTGVLVFLDGTAVDRQSPKAGAAAVKV